MKTIKIILALFSICLYHLAFSQDKYSISGFAELDHISFLKEKDNKINSRNQGILQLDVASNFSSKYSFFSSIEFRNDLSDETRDRVYVDELYMDLFFKKWDLRVGKQIISWGKADGFNPMNTLSPTDYSDVLDTEDEDIGIFALNGKFYLGSMELQLVYSTLFTSSLLPSGTSRWQVGTESTVNIQGSNYNTIYNINVSKPVDKLSSSQFAIKLSQQFNNLDFSLAYFNGYNHIPQLIQSVGTIDNTANTAEINIEQKYYRHQVISGDFSLALGKYIFKGEGSLFIPQDIPVDDQYFQYVVGLDRTFSNVIADNNLFVIIQWMHEITNNGISYAGRDFNHLFQKNIMCRLEMDLSSSTTLSLQGMYAIEYEDYYIRPELTYNISDGLNLSLLADLLGGNDDKGGLFSGYSDNGRVQAKLKYSF
ncbi:MAG: DUF1302 family protein [Bacteroidales bacterium]